LFNIIIIIIIHIIMDIIIVVSINIAIMFSVSDKLSNDPELMKLIAPLIRNL